MTRDLVLGRYFCIIGWVNSSVCARTSNKMGEVGMGQISEGASFEWLLAAQSATAFASLRQWRTLTSENARRRWMASLKIARTSHGGWAALLTDSTSIELSDSMISGSRCLPRRFKWRRLSKSAINSDCRADKARKVVGCEKSRVRTEHWR